MDGELEVVQPPPPPPPPDDVWVVVELEVDLVPKKQGQIDKYEIIKEGKRSDN